MSNLKKTFAPVYSSFSIQDEDGSRYYCISVMSGQARDAFMETMNEYMDRKVDSNGEIKVVPKIDRVRSPHAILYFCVHPATTDGTRSSKKLVDKEIIDQFPVDVLDWAMREAGTINGFSNEGKSAVKNSSSSQSEESGIESQSNSTALSEKLSEE